MIDSLFQFIKKLRLRNWPLSTQIFLMVSLLFVLFIILQQIVSGYIFGNFYIQRQFRLFEPYTRDYYQTLLYTEDDYGAMYTFIQSHSLYTVIMEHDGENYTVQSDSTPYLLTVSDGSDDIVFSLNSGLYHFIVGDEIEIFHNQSEVQRIVTPTHTYTFNSLTMSTESSVGVVKETIPPSNLNYLYINNQVVLNEVNALSERLQKSRVIEGGYWYSHIAENTLQMNLVFVYELSANSSLLIIVPIQGSADIAKTLNTYNSYVYILILFIVTVTSLYVSRSIASPIEKITYAADEIANLNFDIHVSNHTNRETSRLSRSINQLSSNLSSVINQLNTQNQEMKKISEEQMHQFMMKKQLVSSISHELKTPLSLMQIAISAILDDIIPHDEQRNELEHVIGEINHMAEMIKEILDIYRVDSDFFSLNLEKHNLIDVINEAKENIAPLVKNNKKTIHFDSSAKKLGVMIDKKLIVRAFINLLMNAISYSPEDYEHIHINVYNYSSRIIVEIENYGVTIPDDDLPNLFEPFYRVDKSGSRTLRNAGSGLGLYTVKEIFEKHHFDYGIENIKNGVKFYIIIKK